MGCAPETQSPISLDPAFPPEQLLLAGTFQPSGLRLRNPKFPLLRVSLSYHVPHGTWPTVFVPVGGGFGHELASSPLSTSGMGLLLPSPQLAVASVWTGDWLSKPRTGAKKSDCWLVYPTVTCPLVFPHVVERDGMTLVTP